MERFGAESYVEKDKLLLQRWAEIYTEEDRSLRGLSKKRIFGKEGFSLLRQLFIFQRSKLSRKVFPYWTQVLSFLFGVSIPIFVIGGMTHFAPGSSTKAQRVWTMVWLSFSIVIGLGSPVVLDTDLKDVSKFKKTRENVLIALIFLLTYAAPAIGGLVVVGQMIVQTGICSRISQ